MRTGVLRQGLQQLTRQLATDIPAQLEAAEVTLAHKDVLVAAAPALRTQVDWNQTRDDVARLHTVSKVKARLQVRVDGLNPARHVVTCNGRAVPLASTGTSGEAVAGVLTFVRRSWGHDADPIAPEVVAEARKAMG